MDTTVNHKTTLRVPVSLHKRIKKHCSVSGMNWNTLGNRAVAFYLDQIDKGRKIPNPPSN
jgi:predicted DNA binding CopG/RHH family protein